MTSNPAAAPSSTPEPESIHLLLLTIRWNDDMRRVVRAAAEACRRHRNVRLTVADGQKSAELADWLGGVVAETGARIDLVAETGVSERFARALDPGCAWTLMLSDDDPFTVNYLDALIEEGRAAGPEVSAITPSLYLGIDANRRLLTRTVKPIDGADAGSRLWQLYAQPEVNGAIYYSLMRTPVMVEWFAHLQRIGRAPSYSDQLLSPLAAVRGTIRSTREYTVLVRDESNWTSFAACAKADARHHRHPEMALFHQMFWIADLVALLSPHPEFDRLVPAIRRRAAGLLAVQNEAYAGRGQVLGCAATAAELQPLAEVCREIWVWLERNADDVPGIADALRRIVSMAASIEGLLDQRKAAAKRALPPVAARLLARTVQPVKSVERA